MERLVEDVRKTDDIDSFMEVYKIRDAVCDFASAWEWIATETKQKHWKKLWPLDILEYTCV